MTKFSKFTLFFRKNYSKTIPKTKGFPRFLNMCTVFKNVFDFFRISRGVLDPNCQLSHLTVSGLVSSDLVYEEGWTIYKQLNHLCYNAYFPGPVNFISGKEASSNYIGKSTKTRLNIFFSFKTNSKA